MEELELSTSAIVVHLLIACIPWLIGLAVGMWYAIGRVRPPRGA